jgi:hypothetical protein
MKTLKLPDADHADLRQFYEEELDKTLRRLLHIQSILEKIGAGQSVQIQITPGASETLLTAESNKTPGGKTKKTSKKKRGRKSMWEMLVLKRMRQLDRPITYDELTDEIMMFSKLPKEKRKSTKQAIVNVTFRMRTKTKKLDTFSIGAKEKYLALKRWFDKSGEINKAYEEKIKQPKRKKSGNKALQPTTAKKAAQRTTPTKKILRSAASTAKATQPTKLAKKPQPTT